MSDDSDDDPEDEERPAPQLHRDTAGGESGERRKRSGPKRGAPPPGEIRRPRRPAKEREPKGDTAVRGTEGESEEQRRAREGRRGG